MQETYEQIKYYNCILSVKESQTRGKLYLHCSADIKNVLGLYSSRQTIKQSGFNDKGQKQAVVCKCNGTKRVSKFARC